MPTESAKRASSRTSRFGQVVGGVDLARVADADRHAEVAQPRAGAARRVAAQRLDREHGLPAALDLAPGQAVRVGAVAAREVDEVHVGQLAACRARRPRCRRSCSGAPGSGRRGSPARRACAGRARTARPPCRRSRSPTPRPTSRRRSAGPARTPSRKAALSTPARWNMTDAACICSTGVLTVGAPARCATSASPVASITRRARIASRPALDSTTTPTIASPSMTGRRRTAGGASGGRRPPRRAGRPRA